VRDWKYILSDVISSKTDLEVIVCLNTGMAMLWLLVSFLAAFLFAPETSLQFMFSVVISWHPLTHGCNRTE
jgi:hypothetical protein